MSGVSNVLVEENEILRAQVAALMAERDGLQQDLIGVREALRLSIGLIGKLPPTVAAVLAAADAAVVVITQPALVGSAKEKIIDAVLAWRAAGRPGLPP